jgi:hypothetical protein
VGEYFKLSNTKSFGRDLATISNHIPNRYVLSFQPQSPHPGFHALALRVPGYVGLEAFARGGYWAEDSPPHFPPRSAQVILAPPKVKWRRLKPDALRPYRKRRF